MPIQLRQVNDKLLGHWMVKQDPCCISDPEQGLPVADGTGELQLRIRVRSPSPQVAEQNDQLLQSDQPPSTVNHTDASTRLLSHKIHAILFGRRARRVEQS